MNYIKYPNYPSEFNAPSSFLNNKTYNEINRYIRKGINDIILKMELENRNDDDTHTYFFEKGTVEVKYEGREFYITVIYKDEMYTSKVDMDIELKPTVGHWDTYHKIRANIEDEYSFKTRYEIAHEASWLLVYIVILVVAIIASLSM